MEQIEGDILGSLENAFNVSEAGKDDPHDDHFFDDDDGNTNHFITDPVGSHIAHSPVRDGYACKAVLFAPLVPGTRARLWDALLLVPAAAFLAFMLVRLPAVRQRLGANNR